MRILSLIVLFFFTSASLSAGSFCEQVTNGGQIVYNGDVACGAFNPGVISNAQLPTGGWGELEYLWLSSTIECPTETNQAISGATNSTYNPGVITETTYFVRCSRRAGCDSWSYGESNCVIIEVETPPSAIVSNNNPTCGNNDGSISFAFDDTQGRSHIEFSLDGGNNYDLYVQDNSGTASFNNLTAGVYDIFVRWGNNECEVDLGSVSLIDGSQATGSICNDGNDNTINDAIQTDGCTCAGIIPAPTNDASVGNLVFNDSNGNGIRDNGEQGINGITVTLQTPNGATVATTTTSSDGTYSFNNLPAANYKVTFGTPANFTASPQTGNANQGINNDNDANPATGMTEVFTLAESENNSTIDAGFTPNGSGTGTPDCVNITISAGNGSVVVSGLDGAPVSSVQIFNSAWQQEFACFADCNSPTEIIPVAAGEYLVYVKYYTTSYALICEENATITVGGGGPVIIDNDNDGFPANEDCNDNDPSVPATVGSSCNDGNDNTSNDVIMADGCTCVGTPNGGGVTDNDNDGVPVDLDCNDNDPSIPAAVGSVCNDANANTTNDIIQADGCTCAGTVNNGGGTPDCANIGINAINGNIVITGLDGAAVTSVQVFNMAWQGEFSCFADCNSPMETIPVANGEYLVYVKYYTASYALVCEENTTITVGGSGTGIIDNDNDGTPANEDCDDNDPSVPATVGSSCNDGNGSTNNDVILADGCTCAGTPSSGGSNGVDLALSVIGDGNSVGAYQGFSATFTLTNEGTNPSDNITVNIPQPNGVVFEGNNPFNASAGTYDYYTTFNWTVGTLTPGQTETITLNYYTIGTAPYTVYGQVSNASGTDADSTPANGTAPTPNEDDEAVYTTGNGGGAIVDNDNDGVPANEDCNDNDASVPATVGSACNDGNSNTNNDVILADGCTCVGIPNGGGVTDNDNDGVPAAEDCNDNDPSVPATVGSACNDGNSNTNNDVILADGCTCVGTPIVADNCDDILISEENGMISIGGLNSSSLTAVWIFDAAWNTVYNCSYGCQDLETYQAEAGTYFIIVKKLNADWSVICEIEQQINVEGAPQNSVLTLNCANSVTVNTTPGANSAIVTYSTPIANTTCTTGGLNLQRISGPASGSSFGVGTTTVTYQATDNCGNTETCSFTVTVIGTNANLNINCGNNITINAAPGANSATVTYSAPTANTTCNGGVNVTRTSGPASGSSFSVGTTTVTYQATDNCGNVETCSFTVTVIGSSSNVTISCPNNITVDTAPGANSATVNYGNANANTNCVQAGLNVSVTQGPASGASFNVGTTTVKYTATDACGSMAMCTFAVTVNATPQSCNNEVLAKWNLAACESNVFNGSHYDYSEFTPSNVSNIVSSATNIYRDANIHSCTPTDITDGIGMCVTYRNTCSFSSNDSRAVKFSVTVGGTNSAPVTLDALEFFEKSNPATLFTSTTTSYPNNYPTKYGIKVSVNGTEVFKQINISTSQQWSLENIHFGDDPDFTVTSATTFDFELLAYCPSGNPGTYAVWDLDDFKIVGCQSSNYDESEAEERSEEETSFAFGIYPNPATNVVNVSLKDTNNNATIIKVYDQLGRLIERVEVDATYDSIYRINTADYNAGLYLISVQSGDTPPITKQLVILTH